MVWMSYNIVVDCVIIVFVEQVIDDSAHDAGLADFGVTDDQELADLLVVLLGFHRVRVLADCVV